MAGTQKDIQAVVYDLVCTSVVEKELDNVESIEEWRDVIVYSGNVELSDLSRNVQNQIGELILREQIERFGRPETYLTQWQEFCKRKVL